MSLVSLHKGFLKNLVKKTLINLRLRFFFYLTTRQTLKCDGPSKDMRSCSENDCPSWTPWSEWSQCSFTCGGGTCTRERKCRLPDGTKVPNEQCTDGKHKILNN